MTDRTLRQRRADEALHYAKVREQILENWAKGHSLTEMQILGMDHRVLAPVSLYRYAQRIYQDLDVSNQAAAVAEAYRRGYLPCPCSGPVRASDVARHRQGSATTSEG